MARKPINTFAEQERTYKGFIAVTKWSVIVLAVTVVALYFIIQP